ncbi:dTDP-4-dehydrorhamnose 3,5-epimerase [Alcaligenes endophyticus]|uniref:dTDP-4-dehydrorhamnose 3,5-epimerase n=1 Tax=Alcaligenes endophyticus TaxID=1929088 RepID=A0ABT8EFX2_9BURK|nr:dTDP-4-dehydrorhamnose 3,5-epimerase [Alcaligenes endophyticus]MCX5590183.1 dTDP-4-dehydrorhamnose 3,5-epimerase [Alcaligenes endophyticus]MDN4120154.1 dTDP-4-dehydrorhamnose 3,5-epimerase [Alcaligenes endophyticus]
MKISHTHLAGVLIIEPTLHHDQRGHFKEIFNAQRYQELAGIQIPFVQVNQSRSAKGVLRGMHFQKTRPQGKLITVNMGHIYDVVVDIQPTSDTYGQYLAVELSDKNHRQLWVPPGYAHGFCVLSEIADISYQCTEYYFPKDEAGLAWNCPEVNIMWPIENPVLSSKDGSLPRLSSIAR